SGETSGGPAPGPVRAARQEAAAEELPAAEGAAGGSPSANGGKDLRLPSVPLPFSSVFPVSPVRLGRRARSAERQNHHHHISIQRLFFQCLVLELLASVPGHEDGHREVLVVLGVFVNGLPLVLFLAQYVAIVQRFDR